MKKFRPGGRTIVKHCVCASGAATLLLQAAATPALTYPDKAVRLVVTGSPGSSGDTLGRIVQALKLTAE